MTSEQAAQLIQQQQQLLEVYSTMQPLVVNLVRDIFPFGAVLSALGLGCVFGWAAT
jgi:hypothetical protein